MRFKNDDLPRLIAALRLNEPIYRLSNGTKLTNQEILMIGLTRYCTSSNLYGTVCKYFELEFTQMSRAITLFNNHVITNGLHLSTDN
jgi:hypothetical protein